MLKRTEGVVLTTMPLGEADLIATYLTPDYGITKLFAKSPRKIKSRFGSSLEPLTRSRISFWGKEDAALPRLTQSDIIHPFRSLREDFTYFLKISEIIELTIHFIPERDAAEKAYSLLLETLQDLEINAIEHLPANSAGKGAQDRFRQRDLLLNHYKVKFLALTGFAPRIDVCARCSKGGYHFYISQGSVLCESCARIETARAEIGLPIRLSPPVLRFYADLLAWDAARIKRIRPSAALLAELAGLINTHVKYILSKPLKSESFLQSLSK